MCSVKMIKNKKRASQWFQCDAILIRMRITALKSVLSVKFQIINCLLIFISNAILFVFSSLVPDVVFVEGFMNASNDKISPEGTSTGNKEEQ